MPRAEHSPSLLGRQQHVPTCSTSATSTPIVYATPLSAPTVLLAVPVNSTERQLSAQTDEVRFDPSNEPHTMLPAVPAFGAPPAPVPASRQSRLSAAYASSTTQRVHTQRLCGVQAHPAADHVCIREGSEICERCERWVCSEHMSELSGAPAWCKACALDARDGAQRYECLESRCQNLLCTVVCVALLVLFYLGPYRDGRK